MEKLPNFMYGIIVDIDEILTKQKRPIRVKMSICATKIQWPLS